MHQPTITASILSGIRVARISTVSFFLATQLKQQVEYLEKVGMDVVLISSPGDEIRQLRLSHRLRYLPIDIPRDISLLRDLFALMRLYRTFRLEKFSITHSTTPKAGLLTAIAAFFARVPVRIHTFTGQPWVTKTGFTRLITKFCDKIIGKMSTQCYADSHSQVEFLVTEKIVSRKKIAVVANGSLAGVDLERFSPDRFSEQERSALVQSLNIEPDSTILLFVGRICRDKGINELLAAFRDIVSRGYKADLLLVGPLDSECGGGSEPQFVDPRTIARVHLLGYTDCPERYMAIADIHCLPSYREGFGTVVIEAAAMGVPTVGSYIPGLVDAIADGVSGLLVKPRDAEDFGRKLMDLLDHREVLQELSQGALHRVRRSFDANLVNTSLVDEYLRLYEMSGNGSVKQ